MRGNGARKAGLGGDKPAIRGPPQPPPIGKPPGLPGNHAGGAAAPPANRQPRAHQTPRPHPTPPHPTSPHPGLKRRVREASSKLLGVWSSAEQPILLPIVPKKLAPCQPKWGRCVTGGTHPSAPELFSANQLAKSPHRAPTIHPHPHPLHPHPHPLHPNPPTPHPNPPLTLGRKPIEVQQHQQRGNGPLRGPRRQPQRRTLQHDCCCLRLQLAQHAR